MCGRAYETYTEEELHARYLNEKTKRKPFGFRPNYNMSPTQISPVVLVRDGELQIAQLRWGLVPAWAKDVKSASKYSLINARGEEITERRSYKASFEKRRCIVPLSGFIEWKREGESSKRPFAIHLADKSIMSVAGIWEHWVSKETGEIVDSFSIVTTAANSFMEKIHDRMPVILDRADEAEWLDPKIIDTQKVLRLVKPCPSDWIDSYEISPLVNSPRNNSSNVLAPIE